MVNVEIELDNVSCSFFAGEVINGRVIVKNNKPLIIKEVTILLEGRINVRWSTSKHSRSYVIHSKAEKHVSQKTSLVAYNGHNNSRIVESGRTAFPFQIVSPKNVPSSFTSEKGSISYILEAELETPTLVFSRRVVVKLNVIANVDMNTAFGALHPKYLTKVKGTNNFVGRYGQIVFVLHLPRRSGFVVWEIINFSCKVTNSSNKDVTGMTASLRQVVTFRTNWHTKNEIKDFSVLSGPEVKAGKNINWMPNSLMVPAVPPTWTMSPLIEIQYFLHFQLSISGLSDDMSGDIPVMIGTIPFVGNFDQFLLQPPGNVPEPPPPSYLSAISLPAISELAPPTYDEVVFGTSSF